MTTLLFYENPVALNKGTHQNTKIKSHSNNFSFARKTNSVVLAGVEFTEAAKELPIVFAQAGDKMVPVALLGLRNDENLFVDEAGKWDARYVPAFVRRYPFVLAGGEGDSKQVVCIDESYAGFDDKDGEALFADDGEPAPVLKQALGFLEEYQRQYLRTEQFVKRLRENDLLQALNAKVDMVDGQQLSLTGLLVVDEKKLLQLNDEKALELFKSGELAWIYCHLMSLGNLNTMVDRMSKVLAKANGKTKESKTKESKTKESKTKNAKEKNKQ